MKKKQLPSFIQVKCSRCNRVPQKSFITGIVFVTYLCYSNCGNVFWTQKQCPDCHIENYTKLIFKPKTGEKVKCGYCQFQCYYFRCPYKQCRALMYKQSKLYRMGQSTACTECKQYFKLIVCSCGGEIYLDKDRVIYQGVNQFDCKQCQKKVIYATCPQCYQIDYFFQKQQIGQKIKCSHCKHARNFVPCPTCGKSIYSKDFHYGEIQNCNYCQTSFQFVLCPNGCGPIFNLAQNINGPYRTCQGGQCNATFIAINCNKCKNPLYIQQYEWDYCREEQCPACKAQIKFHLCKCGILSKDSNKCQNPLCPVPKGVKNYSKQWKQLNSKNNQNATTTNSVPNNEDYNQNQCKLCYDANSVMVNQNCRHMMMCQECYKNVRNRQHNDNVRCPICKQPGKYHKYVKPILQ